MYVSLVAFICVEFRNEISLAKLFEYSLEYCFIMVLCGYYFFKSYVDDISVEKFKKYYTSKTERSESKCKKKVRRKTK